MSRLVILLIIVAAAAWWFWGRTIEPAKVVHAQLEAIGHHDYERAYGYLSSDAKRRISLEAFREAVNQNATVANNYTAEFLNREVKDGVVTLSGQVRSFNSMKTPVTYVVVKENDRWVIQD